jgi:hypothetical protein
LTESTAPLARAVMVHDAAQVAWALQVADGVLTPGLRLPLVSAPGAANWLSPRLFLAMVAQGAAGAAAAHLPVLDCGASPGHALAALRAGCPALVLSATRPAFATLNSAAAEARAILWPRAPDSLNLADLRANDARATARLVEWLRG